ncbi:hypothetical protein GJ744_005407 [Endocarpon pusillum]|uniref:pyridoxal kinase n=1 Tax=Endocarpon pusillum TaxID=364733 RepID=A0A8H7A4W2_9EURO|nr:hypothetical protein GJ744_005407 [Endocarpon pusillum]
MNFEPAIPETKVLAIASHVVYGYVGNTMATFVMQALGCDVAALNTVHFSMLHFYFESGLLELLCSSLSSTQPIFNLFEPTEACAGNHTGYRQVRGTKASAQEIRDIYDGLCQSYLTDFDMLLSGYSPNAETVQAVGVIARDLRFRSTNKPGSFFWVLDPVMGDQGRLYVNEDVVPAYKSILRDADLILPNQFEAETLSGIPIHSLPSLATAISMLHTTYLIPHIIVTSIRLTPSNPTLSIIGSTFRPSNHTPRLFKIEVPALPCFFSGTGDMFAALMVVRLREACLEAGVTDRKSWVSGDDVSATELPLAKATEKVLASMQMVLEKTMQARDRKLAGLTEGGKGMSSSSGVEVGGDDGEGKRRYLAETKAAEVRVVRNVRDLWCPEERYEACELQV